MKRMLRASKAGRSIAPDSTRYRIIKISIVIYLNESRHIESSTSPVDPEDLFFSKMMEHLESADYLPYLNVDVMQKKFHSPFSNSEYYVFLKIDGTEKVKLILDIRFADHPSPEYGNSSSHDRHVKSMPLFRNPGIAKDGFDTSDASLEFYDVEVYNNELKIVIDGQASYTVEDALALLDQKIEKLP